MEKLAIISDVHGNITALNAVFNDIEERKINKIYCLGDYVMKSCHADLVIDLVKEKCDVLLKGNCDVPISRPDIPKGRYWTRDLIGEERAAFLYNLPISYDFYMSGYLIRLFHSSPFGLDYIFNPMFSNENNYYANQEIKNPMDMFENTEFLGKSKSDPIPDIVGYGHIHTPNIIRARNKTIFNPGSVGAPIEMLNDNFHDETNKFSTVASYMILDGILDSRELAPIDFNLVRLPYDVDKEVELLKKSNLPAKDKLVLELKSATNYSSMNSQL